VDILEKCQHKQQLETYSSCSLLIKATALPQLLVQFSFGSILQDKIDPALVIEISVQPEDIWMPIFHQDGKEDAKSNCIPQVRLYLDFPSQLVFYTSFGELTLK
jgi:hypothetical protein